MASGPPAGSSPDFARLAALSDQEWFGRILEAYAPDGAPSGPLCGYPSEELQVNTVGCSGRTALTHAFRFWVDVRQSCRSLGLVLAPATRILDFGCGWGRITRFFFRDTRPENITGIDVDADFIAICRRIMSGGSYQVVRPLPPTELPSGSLDLVVGYSVFSHLAAHVADAWMREFARLLRPGGVVAVTTRPRSFLDYCESLTKTPGRLRRCCLPFAVRGARRRLPTWRAWPGCSRTSAKPGGDTTRESCSTPPWAGAACGTPPSTGRRSFPKGMPGEPGPRISSSASSGSIQAVTSWP